MTTRRSTRLRTFCSLHHDKPVVNLPVSKKCQIFGIFGVKCLLVRACVWYKGGDDKVHSVDNGAADVVCGGV